MLLAHVTLCLLITYHWPGSSAGSTGVCSVPEAAAAAATAGIAAEVNGSPTDARLNIPVVKRSSNQAAFANELRSIVGKRAGIVELVGALFELPHEYANRNVEKHSNEKKTKKKKKLVVPTVVSKRVANVPKEETKEKGKVVPGIKSSIRTEDAMETRLIGKASSTPVTLNHQRRFHYERASTTSRLEVKKKKNVQTNGNGDAEEAKKIKKKAIWGNQEENNRDAIISSVFVPDSSDSPIHRIRREARVTRQEMKEGRRNDSLLLSDVGKIDREMEQQWKEKQEDYYASGMSNRLSFSSSLSSLKLTGQQQPQMSKLTGESNKILDSRRLHQQSRNTEPRTITQHLQRNIKRQTTFDDNVLTSTSNFGANRNRDFEFVPLAYNRNQREANNRQIPNTPSYETATDSELRFIPANNYRPDNRIYYQRTLLPLPPPRGFQENVNDGSPFISNSDDNSPEFPNFTPAQLENLKNSIRGVFDKYESRQQGQTDLFPNVRMIQSKQIFVAPPRLIYDTKILPAPFSLNPYFENPSSSFNSDNDHHTRLTEPSLTVNGVFDQSHKDSELDHREVIPVREDSPPSLTSTRNFVTPLPPYRTVGVGGGGGELSVRVNPAAEDPNVSNEIYRVNGEPGISESKNESQRDKEDEDSRVNHESPIEAGVEHHFGTKTGVGASGSSYDNSAGTFDNRGESGSTNVDHASVIVGTTDEYVNRLPAVRTRIQSPVESNDNTYDRGSYKWRDNNNHDHYAANYSFGYRVSDYKSENEFGHQETRNEGITNGKYHVKLPDGRIQKVNYHVDDGGYHASVSYHRDGSE